MKNALIMIFKLSPIALLCALVMSGFDTLVAAPLSLFYAVLVCWAVTRRKVMDIIESAMTNVKNAIIIFFIFMMAYAVATLFMTTGVGASIIMAAITYGL